MSLPVTFICQLKITATMRSCVCFDRMHVEHMQIGQYCCNKVAMSNKGGIVVNHYFFSERLFPKDIYITNVSFKSILESYKCQIAKTLYPIWGLQSRPSNPPAPKLRNSQFSPNGPNWKFLAHNLLKDRLKPAYRIIVNG